MTLRLRVRPILRLKMITCLVLCAALPGVVVGNCAASVKQNQAARPDQIVVPAGIELTVALKEGVTSKTHFAGESVPLEVLEDVSINGRVVIVRGAHARGRISHSEESAGLGRNGSLGIDVETTTSVDGQEIKLAGSYIVIGASRKASTFTLAALIGPLGFMNRGKEAKIKSGTRIKAHTGEEKTVRVGN
jgi:hypothetical protein